MTDTDGIGTVSEANPVAEQTFTLASYPEKLAIVKLPPGAEVPRWAESSSLFSVTATATETSLVCAGRSVPTKTPSIRPLIAHRVVDELEPGQIGVLVSILAPLAEAGIPAYTLSTFETDWILVRVSDVEAAAEAWRRRGHRIGAAVPVKPSTPKPASSPKKSRK